MSGGSYNYLCYKIEEEANRLQLEGGCRAASSSLRRAFKAHLYKVAKAMHAIEWNDSNDGHDGETDLIRACLGEGEEIAATIAQAESIIESAETTCTELRALMEAVK